MDTDRSFEGFVAGIVFTLTIQAIRRAFRRLWPGRPTPIWRPPVPTIGLWPSMSDPALCMPIKRRRKAR